MAMQEMLRARLMALGSLLMVFALFALDVRDLYFKLHMLGPYDSYSFRSTAQDTIQATYVPKPTDTINLLSNGSSTAASGWPSFYSRCETMNASGTDTSRFFLTTLASNCEIDISVNKTRIVPHLLMTTSYRADVMAWVACQLVYLAQRPPICQDSIVMAFNNRYMMQDEVPTYDEMAQPGSDEEAEMLRFLDMISLSYPLTHVTCAEAFELGVGESGNFRASVFGCGSANLYRSEWLGFVHKGVAKFLVTKAWLTADVLSVMGIRYGIRQNSIDIYDVSYPKATGRLVLTSSSLINFSSFGHLYAISILIDMALLVAHVFTIFEVLKWVVRPQYVELHAWMREFEAPANVQLMAPKSIRHGLSYKPGSTSPMQHHGPRVPAVVSERTNTGSFVFKEAKFYSFFQGSFYRNQAYVLWTTVTQVLSWIIILPNAVIWTWSESSTQKIQGYLCSIKCWVLIATSVNFVWSACVYLNEKRAYQFVRGTYLTNAEIILVGGLVALWHSESIFAISTVKYGLEQQRLLDFSSFKDGYLCYGNSYEKAQDHVSTTSFAVIWAVYKPLVNITLWSILFIALYLTAKFAFFYFTEREGRDILLKLLGRPPRPQGAAMHIAGRTNGSGDGTGCGDGRGYHRLALEDALGFPIRAHSLVRSSLQLEIIKDGKAYVHPNCYLEFGVMLKHGHMQSKNGVFDIFTPSQMEDIRAVTHNVQATEDIPHTAN